MIGQFHGLLEYSHAITCTADFNMARSQCIQCTNIVAQSVRARSVCTELIFVSRLGHKYLNNTQCNCTVLSCLPCIALILFRALGILQSTLSTHGATVLYCPVPPVLFPSFLLSVQAPFLLLSKRTKQDFSITSLASSTTPLAVRKPGHCACT